MITTRPATDRTRVEADLAPADEAVNTTPADTSAQQVIGRRIEQQFARHGIHVEIVETAANRRVTTYFFRLADGEERQISKIGDGLRRAIEVSLGISGVNIEAPVPDTSLIAVRVPSTGATDDVPLADFINEAHREDSLRLPCPLGEDLRGKSRLIDLSVDCHQLVAGQTGSGKSMFLKALIVTLAASRSPERVRLVLIDGKGLEFVAFQSLPHLACPIVTDVQKATRVMRQLHDEMLRRQNLLRNAGLGDVWANQHHSREAPALDLPALVVIIDEVQVFTQDSDDQIGCLLRSIAQQGRACGIVLILATQRPTVDIVQGSIKANLPGRISFRLPTQTDSRVVLDGNGAETLRGPGEMLAIETSLGHRERFHAPVVTQEDIERVTGANADAGQNHQLFVVHDLPHQHFNSSGPCNTVVQIEYQADTQESPTTMSDVRFLKAHWSADQVRALVHRRHPDADVTAELHYRPYALGSIRTWWRRPLVLFDLVDGHFVTGLLPFTTTPLWSLELDPRTSRSVLTQMLGATGRWSDADDIGHESLWPLVEAGVAIIGPKGVKVRSSYAAVPTLDAHLDMALLPEHSAGSAALSIDTATAMRRLRRDLAELWSVNLDELRAVAAPFWLIGDGVRQMLEFPAFGPYRDDVDADELLHHAWVVTAQRQA